MFGDVGVGIGHHKSPHGTAPSLCNFIHLVQGGDELFSRTGVSAAGDFIQGFLRGAGELACCLPWPVDVVEKKFLFMHALVGMHGILQSYNR